jgi:hypothetical protein
MAQATKNESSIGRTIVGSLFIVLVFCGLVLVMVFDGDETIGESHRSDVQSALEHSIKAEAALHDMDYGDARRHVTKTRELLLELAKKAE